MCMVDAASSLSSAAAEPFAPGQPLVFAVGRLGEEAYWQWVERPVPGQPRFFGSNAAERCTTIVWWVVPMIWLPVYGLATAGALERAQARDLSSHHAPLAGLAAQQLLGLLLWQAFEYSMHRWMFHLRAKTYWAITLHFLFHGNHHKFPGDHLRLVFPPVPAAVITALVYGALRLLLGQERAPGVWAGMLLGYIAYDCLHYAMHHAQRMPGGWQVLQRLRARHLHHHFRDHTRAYGISSILFDVLLGTAPTANPM